MKLEFNPLSIRESFAVHERDGGGRILRGRFYGHHGQAESLGHAARTGNHVGASAVFTAQSARKALANVLRNEWDTAGRVLTLRVFRKEGESWIPAGSGIVSSGPTTVKGVAQNTPALPDIGCEGAGEFRIEVETDGVVRYAAEFQG